MKKIFLLVAVTMSMYMIAIAQERRAGPEKKGFLILSAGPSFPLGNFSSTTFDINSNTPPKNGFAKTGFNLDLQGGYHFVKNFGVTGSVFYNLYSYDEQRLKDQLGIPAEANMRVDHWKYYGIVAGPMLTATITPKTSIDFNVMTGVISANSPKAIVSDDGTGDIVNEDWSTAVPIRVGSGMRFQFGENGYFGIGMNYFFAEPRFKTLFLGETYEAHQQLSALTVNAGIGFRF